jgi:predicted DCC family thiol-disulfide oxidoreductase YuxK
MLSSTSRRDGRASRPVVIFDGICNFCNGAVNFIIRRDPKGLFSFTPMQSQIGRMLIDKYGATAVGLDTFLLIKDGKCYERTDAAFEIAKDLTGYWYLLNGLKVIPRRIRDSLYSMFARNRYSLCGRRDACMVPTANLRSRFLE